MQRKLLLALIGIALASVILVGAGVLLFAQFGSRQSARDDVVRQLQALGDLADSQPLERFDRQSLQRFQNAFGSAQLDFVAIRSDGELVSLPGRGPRPPVDDGPSIDQEQMALLLAGEILTFDSPGSVVGIRLLEQATGQRGLGVALLSRADVATVDSRTRTWFGLSALAVLAGAALLAMELARRLVAPVKDIDAATQRIAAGDLSARVEVNGDDELAALGNSVNSMAADLDRSRTLEQQFLMSVSHDLRTPLSAIQGYAEALTDGAMEQPAEAGQIISNHASRLNRLVGDLLDLSRLSARQFHMHPEVISLVDLTVKTIAGFEPRANEQNVKLVLEQNAPDGGVIIHADPDRVSQILSNLLDNALKFAASTVTISVGSQGTTAHLAVVDDGAGIPLEDLPHVFERLYVTRQAPLRKENSSGLGLAIVHELCDAMGGSVSVVSPAGQGTSFTVQLPVQTEIHS